MSPGLFPAKDDEANVRICRRVLYNLLYTDVFCMGPADKGELFPGAYPEEQDVLSTHPLKKQISPVTITGIVSPVVLFGILFIIYRFILSNIGDNLLGLVP